MRHIRPPAHATAWSTQHLHPDRRAYRRSRLRVDSNARAGNWLTRLGQIQSPHSLVPTYAQVTDCLGSLHFSGEYDAAQQVEQVEDAHMVIAHSLCVTLRALLRREASPRSPEPGSETA